MDQSEEIWELRELLHQERERAQQYRMVIADVYSQLPEIPSASACPICHRFVWNIGNHKSGCLYRILNEALSK